MRNSDTSNNSLVSRTSATSTSEQSKNNPMQMKKMPFEVLFPIYDLLTKEARLPYFVTTISFAIVMLQVILQSFWSVKFSFISSNNVLGEITRYLIIAFLWFDPRDPANMNVIQGIVCISIFAVSAIFTCSIVISYSRTLSIHKAVLYVYRVIADLVFPILIFPSITFTGQAIVEIILKRNGMLEILIGVVCFFATLFFLFAFTKHYELVNRSPCLPKSYFITFIPTFFTMFLKMCIVFEYISFVFAVLPNWATTVLAFLSIGLHSYIIYFLIYQPFMKIHVNSAFMGTSVACIVNSVIQGIQGAGVLFYNNTVLFSTVAAFVLTWIISYYLFKRQTKKITKLLNKDSMDSLASDHTEKLSYLDSLGLCKNQRMYLLFLYVSIDSVSPFFLDGVIIRYWLELYDSEEISAVITLAASFLPMHARLLSSTFSRLAKRNSPSFQNRFLIYSLSRLKICRQTSNSGMLLDGLSRVKMETKKCTEIVRGFWISTPPTTSSFDVFRKTIKNVDNHFKDFINNFPNSSSGYSEYATFLIESRMDFASSALQHHKFTLLEEGHSLTKDVPFRSFIAHYPHYLKRKVVDFKGNIISKRRTGTSSSKGGNSSSSSLSLDMINEIAPEEEESSAKALYAGYKLRLAFQRATENMNPKFSICFKSSIIFVTIISIIALIVIDVVFSSYFDRRVFTVNEIKHMNDARYYMSLSRLALTLSIAKAVNKFEIDDSFREIIGKDVGLSHYIEFDGDLPQQIINFQNKGNDNFNTFIDMIVSDAIAGEPIYETARALLKQEVNISFCDSNSKPIDNDSMSSLKSIYTFLSVVLVAIMKEEQSTWPSTVYFCSLVSNLKNFETAYESYYDTSLSYVKSEAKTHDDLLKLIDIYLPIALFVISFAILATFLGLTIRDFSSVLSLLQHFPQQQKEVCIRPIAKALTVEDNSYVNVSSSCIFIKYFVSMFVIVAVIPILMIIALTQTTLKNKGLEYITEWTLLGSARAPLLSECLEHLCLAVMHDLIPSTTKEYEIEEALKLNELASKRHGEILNGQEDIEPCMEFDEELDSIQFSSPCEYASDRKDIHERYKCATLSLSFSFFSSFVKEAVSKIDTITTLNDAMILNLLHILNTHMSEGLFKFSNRLATIAEQYESSFTKTFLIITVVGVLWAVVSFFILEKIAFDIDDLYHYAISLLRRIPPHNIAGNKEVMDFILNKKHAQSKASASISHNVILSSPDGILFLSKLGIVEMINESVTTILGYVPDQILGQHISILFEDDEVVSYMKLMKTGEAKEYYEAHTDCISDNSQKVPCNVKVISMKKEGNIDSFAMFIKDEAELAAKQKAAEDAKVMSENLLFQILPRDIVNRINQGETDITFTVPTASIMFIDIVRFSDYASNLTPQQIMTNLGSIFESFDKCLTKYSTVTKIKLIGDVYMCASGLFIKENTEQKPAEEILKLAMDCISELDALNTQLEAILQVRVGINTGGPIIGGILGTDKPMFDIIGDAINVASRLQSTCIPNKAQISLSTYELVKGLDYSFEHRNDVFLKGKGSVETFIVSPANILLTSTDVTASLLSLTSHMF